jgi:hypothetical protein
MFIYLKPPVDSEGNYKIGNVLSARFSNLILIDGRIYKRKIIKISVGQ